MTQMDMEEHPYFVTTKVNGRVIENRVPLEDPFVRTTTTTEFSRWDLVKLLFSRKPMIVQEVELDGTQECIKRVMNLKYGLWPYSTETAEDIIASSDKYVGGEANG